MLLPTRGVRIAQTRIDKRIAASTQHPLSLSYLLPDTGWNFRHAHFHEDSRRTLVKVFGLRFVITVDGTAGKFSLRNTGKLANSAD